MRGLIFGVMVSLCLLLPSALLLWLWRTRAESRVYFFSLVALTGIVLVVLRFSELGAWYVVGPFWPGIFGVAFAAAVITRAREGLPDAWLPDRWSRESVLTAVCVLLAASASLMLPMLWRARAYEGEPLALSSPLRGSRFHVMGGGANASVNHHAFIPAQRYAVDVVRLNALGIRAAGISPDDLADYKVFGTEVVAPCEGEVLAAENQLPNRALMDPDVEHHLGNHVVIFCEGQSVVLAHLQTGSVAVGVGDRVAAGQKLGTVGNSGSTMEPHLHLHAVSGRHADAVGVATPLLIDGRFLVKGDSFKSP